MPTIGHPPTHLSTQAVGVALLHQFARDRFREENVAESLIEDAEQELGPEINEFFSFSEDQDDYQYGAKDEQNLKDDGEQQQRIDTPSQNLRTGDANQSSSDRSANGQGLNLSSNSTSLQLNNNGCININSSIGPLNSTAKPHDFSGDESTFHSMASSNDGNNLTPANDSNSSIADSNVTLTNDNRQPSRISTLNMTQGDSIYHSMNNTAQRGHKDPDNTNASTSNDPNDQTNYNVLSIRTRSSPHHRVKPNLDKHLDSTFKAFGQTLRKLADDFAKSKERQTVRDQASRVQLESVNQKSFLELLDGLFAGGITSEKIVVLFFFCVDVAVRAFSEARNLVVELLKWSFSFIINTVCKKVEELGGWEKVLFYQMPSVLVSCLAVLGIGALVTYLHKSLRN